jgi:hypothetical protein
LILREFNVSCSGIGDSSKETRENDRLFERVEAMTDKQRKNTENLKPWKKGESGNPAGRPKKEDSLTSLLKIEMERIDPSDGEGRTWNERIVVATLRLAEQGVPAVRRPFNIIPGL